MEIAEVVIQTIKEAGVPMKSAEIAQKTGIDKKEIDKAIGKLKKEEKLVSPKVCYYDIKK
ncbi:MAG TPA: MarR family transcriptional regulator [Bacteroidales bacterium]|nr:MarR family transcriptional regulator [Bacteroidales bacterium]